ncbi:hypothetical protein P170DRAFT_474371 [Aspergillus steynii IBT 23096]|uniref:Uncharacterized protein n=1 Tax=Aspergillus steynii IBT 23096 TaxID=1392250 RepID=A0A2I2GD51_9EURO|nr:uncharacterized protein P170DRAFT_474371 [Aspergillus steynii IBT 23096]PLB50818.1 hypothetical protein P170DRAFT_474371 [Aspergillus steynii IBT 23096]
MDMSSVDLTDMGTLIRAVLDDPNTSRPRISGITQLFYSARGPCALPNDPQKVKIGYYVSDRGPCQGLCQEYSLEDFDNFPKSREEEKRIVGYPVHMHCWIILTWIIGKELLESNLNILLKSAQKLDRDQRGMVDETLALGFDILYARGEDGKRRCLNQSYQSPAFVPRIQCVIDEAREMRPRTDAIRKRWKQPLVQIPADLILIIIEKLRVWPWIIDSGFKDIINAMCTFQWILCDTYWQGYCARTLVFEYEGLIESKQLIDWQFLSLRVRHLFDGHQTFHLSYRTQLIWRAQKIEKDFLKSLKANQYLTPT